MGYQNQAFLVWVINVRVTSPYKLPGILRLRPSGIDL